MTDNVVQDYGWTISAAPQSCDYIAPAVLRLLGKFGARRVVDIGSGSGALCAAINAGGTYCAGVEYDGVGVEIARKNHPDIRFHRFSVQDDPREVLALEDAKFDVAVSTEVIEHLFAPHLLPRYAHGLLVDGGYVIVSTPYHGYLKNLALSIFNKWDKHHTALWHGGHVKFWSRDTLTRLLQANGFDVVDFVGVGRMPYLWKSMILVARKRTGT